MVHCVQSSLQWQALFEGFLTLIEDIDAMANFYAVLNLVFGYIKGIIYFMILIFNTLRVSGLCVWNFIQVKFSPSLTIIYRPMLLINYGTFCARAL